MNLMSILLSILFALVFSSLLVFVFNRRVSGPVSGMLFLFLIIFLFTWGIGAWLVPVGPVHRGVYWLGYLFIAVLTMLLLGVLLPPAKPRSRVIRKAEIDEKVNENEVSKAITISFGAFFWLLMLALFALALFQLLESSPFLPSGPL